MDKTYVVYCMEYYFNCNFLSTNLKKRVYNVMYNVESAEEIMQMIKEGLQKIVDSGELNANNEILTSYDVKVITLDGKFSIDEAREKVINDDCTWGKVGHSK